jgi:hypothetical protein
MKEGSKMGSALEDNPQKKADELKAGPGMHVVIAFILGQGEELLEFDIVADEVADFARGFLGAGTPLATAIDRQPVGAVIPYSADDVNEVRILELSPSQVTPPANVQERRQEVLRKAVEASDRTNAVIFASSFSGKWGDYDPTGFLDEEK